MVTKFAGHGWDHLEWTPSLNSYRKNSKCGHTIWGKHGKTKLLPTSISPCLVVNITILTPFLYESHLLLAPPDISSSNPQFSTPALPRWAEALREGLEDLSKARKFGKRGRCWILMYFCHIHVSLDIYIFISVKIGGTWLKLKISLWVLRLKVWIWSNMTSKKGDI